MSDTTVTKMDFERSRHGAPVTKHLAFGKNVAMRFWEGEPLNRKFREPSTAVQAVCSPAQAHGRDGAPA